MILRTVAVIVTLALGLLAAPLAAEAQEPRKVPRIGFLHYASPQDSLLPEAFRQGLRELGYVEGQNIAIEYRWAEGKAERFQALAAELVRLKVDVIVTAGTQGITAAKQATSTIPIVMAAVGNAVGAGFVTSLARPGANVTGLSFLNTEISAKRLELLKETLPKVSRVAVLSDSTIRPDLSLEATKVTARPLALQLQILEVRSPNDFDATFEAAKRGRAEALNVLSSAIFNFHRRRLAQLAAKYRLPAMYELREYVEAGGLMAYGPSLPDLYRRAATYVDKILKGAKPADLPVEQPTRFELVINRKTAKALGLTIPPSVLIRADQVIQ